MTNSPPLQRSLLRPVDHPSEDGRSSPELRLALGDPSRRPLVLKGLVAAIAQHLAARSLMERDSAPIPMSKERASDE